MEHRLAKQRPYTTRSLRNEALPAASVLSSFRKKAIDEERSLLGAVLFSGDGECVAEAWGEKLLRDPRHEVIAGAINQLRSVGTKINLQTVSDHVASRNQIEQTGGAHYIAALTSEQFIPGCESVHLRSVRIAWDRYDAASTSVGELEKLLYGEEVLL